MVMNVKFWELSYHEMVHALKNIDPLQEIGIVEDILIAEANVFLCKFRDKRFNLYFDLDYGAEIIAVDKIEKEDLKKIEELIFAAASK